MSNERHARLRALYEEVVDLPREQRMAVLRQRSDDESLIAEVAALCRASDGDSTTRVFAPLDATLKSAAAPPLKPGDVLDVWRVVREIGQGGMGAVFLVERSDGHFAQSAALKLVKGLQRAGTLNYFSRERQLLATLTHPNIARLLDGGATPGGHPYLVMEYVDGVAIDAWCRDQRLSLPQVLTLFATACEAVAFAHRQLVVHCDLKPSNLMVDRGGRPVLLDFGIARLIERVGAQADDAVIGSSIAYTPRYASPEQREHGVVSTVSDIYSLGVLLRDLIGIAGKADAELAAIFAKATAEAPERRYATVDALVGDLHRYLSREPLQAVLPTPGYLTRKFLQRRWPLVLAGVAFAATVAGFTWRVVQESNRAQGAEKIALAERDRAQAAEQRAVKERDDKETARAEALRERDRAAAAEHIAADERNAARTAEGRALADRDKARAAEKLAIAEKQKATQAERQAKDTSEFLVSIFENSNPTAEESDVPASKLIAAAEKRLAETLADQPGTQAELYSALARVQGNLGHEAEQIRVIERAVELERKLDRPLMLAQMLQRRAEAWRNKDTTKAAEYEREALAIIEKHATPDSAEVGNALVLYGHMLSEDDEREKGKPYIERGAAILEKHDPRAEDTMSALYSLGLNQYRLNDYAGAEATYRRAIALRTELSGAEHPETMRLSESLVDALMQQKRYAEAEELARRNLAAREKLYGADSPLVARLYATLGKLVGEAGRPIEAPPLFERAHEIYLKTYGINSVQYAVVNNNLAVAYYQLQDYAAALPMFESARTYVDKNLSPQSDAIATVRRSLANVLCPLGRYEEGARYAKESLAHTRQYRGENSSQFLLSLQAETHCLVVSAPLAEAKDAVVRMEKAVEARKGNGGLFLTLLRAHYAEREGRDDQALTLWLEYEAGIAKDRGPTHLSTWMEKQYRAAFLYRRNAPGDRAAAAVLAQQIIEATKGRVLPKSVVVERLQRIAEGK